MTATSNDSVIRGRIRRVLLAPSAARRETSASLSRARVRVRLAVFTQAITNRSTTPANASPKRPAIPPMTCSLWGVTTAPTRNS